MLISSPLSLKCTYLSQTYFFSITFVLKTHNFCSKHFMAGIHLTYYSLSLPWACKHILLLHFSALNTPSLRPNLPRVLTSCPSPRVNQSRVRRRPLGAIESRRSINGATLEKKRLHRKTLYIYFHFTKWSFSLQFLYVVSFFFPFILCFFVSLFHSLDFHLPFLYFRSLF